MNRSNKKVKIIELLEKYLPNQGIKASGIPGLDIFRRDIAYESKPLMYKPQLLILAQGSKKVVVGSRTYGYDSDNYFVQILPLPVECNAILSPGKPMLGLAVKLDPQIIGELLIEMEASPSIQDQDLTSLYSAATTDDIRDTVIRLLESLDSPQTRKVLGPLYLKELVFKVLTGSHGEVLKALAYSNRGLYQIASAINIIHTKFHDNLDVQTLAQEAGMSPSVFHAKFKAVTSSSPIQYIKNIRLHKAKELIQSEGQRAYEAAASVGYESPSQFSREYKRLFGISPARDSADSSGF